MNLKQLLNEDKQAIVLEFENLIKNQEKIKKYFLNSNNLAKWFELESSDDISKIKKIIKESKSEWVIENNDNNGFYITLNINFKRDSIDKLLNLDYFPNKINEKFSKDAESFLKSYKNSLKKPWIYSYDVYQMKIWFSFENIKKFYNFKGVTLNKYDAKRFDKMPDLDKVEQPQKYKIGYELIVKSPYDVDYESKIFTGTEKEAKDAARGWALSIIKKHKNYYNDKIREGDDSFSIEASYGDEEISASIYYYYKKA